MKIKILLSAVLMIAVASVAAAQAVSGSLYKTSDNATVYLVEGTTKYAITSAEAFSERGFDWGSIQTTDQDVLDGYESGDALLSSHELKRDELEGKKFVFVNTPANLKSYSLVYEPFSRFLLGDTPLSVEFTQEQQNCSGFARSVCFEWDFSINPRLMIVTENPIDLDQFEVDLFRAYANYAGIYDDCRVQRFVEMYTTDLGLPVTECKIK